MARHDMKRSLFLFTALLVAGFASAQQNEFDFRASDLSLLQAKQVQSDLGVTAAQRTKLNAAADAHKSRLEAYQKQLGALGTAKPDPARLRGMLQQVKTEALAILTPPQLKRLRELTLQRLGLIALTDKEVATRVGLSDAQRDKIKAAFQAGRSKFQSIQASARTSAAPIVAKYKDRKPKNAAEAATLKKEIDAKVAPIRAKIVPQLQAVGKQTDQNMLAVLTPLQKSKWAALKGRLFTAK